MTAAPAALPVPAASIPEALHGVRQRVDAQDERLEQARTHRADYHMQPTGCCRAEIRRGKSVRALSVHSETRQLLDDSIEQRRAARLLHMRYMYTAALSRLAAVLLQ